MKNITGKIRKHQRGFGFLIPDDPKLKDNIFIKPEELDLVMQGDTIEVSLRRGRHELGPRGELVRIIKRNQTHVVGTITRRQGSVWVQRSQEDPDPSLKLEEKCKLIDGTLVLAQITTYPSRRDVLCGKVERALDDIGANLDVLQTCAAKGWPFEFSQATIDECERMKLDEGLTDGRQDLSDVPFVTIDGEDAKDFDDAVAAVETSKNNIRVYVAIADVSHYVQTNSPTDEDAFARATSVYFPGTVRPMLPEKISNFLCSLRPDEDKNAMVCEMNYTPGGKLKRYRFFNARIRSQRRCTYAEIETYLKSRELKNANSKITQSIDHLFILFKKMLKDRVKRGALDFEIPEPRVYVDDQGHPTQIINEHRYDSHKLIEEWMIAANVCAADFIIKNYDKGVFRNHHTPEKKKITMFLNLAKQHFPRQCPTLKEVTTSSLPLQKFINSISDPIKIDLFHMLTLRSLAQAVYEDRVDQHYGLGLGHYTHFTSPIRRYPDLMVHRLIKNALKGNKKDRKKVPPDGYDLASANHHCSTQERTAMEIERKVKDIKKARFMEPRMGEPFSSKVIGVTSIGMFVRLLEYPIEGLVPLSTLPSDDYKVDDAHQSILGRHPKHRYHLGDQLEVQCTQADIEQGKVTFELIYDGPH